MVGLKICAITEGIRSISHEKHDKIVYLAKTRLNTIDVLISRALIDSYINCNEFCFDK